ncbi:hypothetical protein I5L03_02450 [Erythrobacter sp. JGD-13]|uniref:Porin n=2 Tax=Aurantiacibacter sediminis TaxID=2793064 RepID=A0ABS0N2A7_9SPHN|nr:hypothetical protein [Aurantiacibacter sediminis]
MASAQDMTVEDRLAALEERLGQLEEENRELREQVDAAEQTAIVSAPPVVAPAPALAPVETVRGTEDRDLIGVNSTYAFAMLDHTENITTRPLVQLEAQRDGLLDSRVTLSGQVTAIANYQRSDTDDKFGYLMRHPTSVNQLGDNVSEAVLHSVSLAFTANVAPRVTAYGELLYDPQQSFGGGTITSLTRNQIQLRRGWIMYGDLNETPVYALIGKMDVPFGLNDTVSPFTNSTNWHAFAALAYGAQVGFVSDGFHVRAMAVQGGAQFRSANVPVQGSSTPSRLNNFAVDARYTLDLGGYGNNLMVGASYLHGTAYCQGYPVFHFNPCQDNNPGIAAYARLEYGDLELLGEYAETTQVWEGTQVPNPMNPLSVFEAFAPSALTIGARYGFGPRGANSQRPIQFSAEFSRFLAGPEGAPWRRQNQIVAGLSWQPLANVNLFGEFIHVDGFVPLNFLSGGNFPDGSTWSDPDVDTDVVLVGAQVAF